MPRTGGLETLAAHVGLWRIGEEEKRRGLSNALAFIGVSAPGVTVIPYSLLLRQADYDGAVCCRQVLLLMID